MTFFPRAQVAGSLLFIVVATLFVYSGSLDSGFVDWDDQEYVLHNPYIKNLSLPNIRKIFTSIYQATYDPLVFLSFSIEYALVRLDPFYYHLTNVLLHCANSALVFFLALTLSKNILLSFVSGLLFGVHPLHVESVAWIAERKDVLAGLFYLLSLLCYIFYRKRGRYLFYGISILLFVLSLLAKPAGITLPVIMLAYDLLLYKKTGNSLWLDKIPFFILSLVCGGIALYAQKTGGGVDVEVSFSIPEKLYIIYYSYFFYILKNLFPVNLSALYPYPETVSFLSPLSVVSFVSVALCGVSLILFRKYRVPVFWAVFFFLALVPAIKIIPFGNSIVADRFMYFPSMGLSVLLALGMMGCFGRIGNATWRWYGAVAMISAVIVCFSLLTRERCAVWKDSMALWTDTVSMQPKSEIAHFGLGNAYLGAGTLNRAISEYEQALSLAPTYVDAYINLGNALQKAGRLAEAEKIFNKALLFDTTKPQLFICLGNLYREKGQLDDALACYSKASSLNPLVPEAHLGMGNIYRKKGLIEQAMQAYHRATTLDPDAPAVYVELGLMYREQGNPEEALNQYRTALAVDPACADAYNNSGWIYLQQGDYERALQHFEQAVKKNPALFTAYDNMVQTYLKMQDYGKAVDVYRRCLAAQQNQAAFQRLIGLYFKLGRKEDVLKACAGIAQGSPLYGDSLFCLGDYYRREGDLVTAIEKYRLALAFKKDDPQILFSLGLALFQQGKIAEAIEQVEQAKAVGLKNAAFCTQLGIIYYNHGMAERAMKEFKEALQLDSTAIQPHVYLAKIYAEKLYDRKEAAYHLRKVLEMDPASSQADRIREEMQRLEGNSE